MGQLSLTLLCRVVGSFLSQPQLFVAIIFVALSYWLRITGERKHFRIAINRDCFEARFFIKTAVVGGIIASGISVILGISVTPAFLVMYWWSAMLAMLLWLLVGINLSLLALVVAFVLTWQSQATITDLGLLKPSSLVPASLFGLSLCLLLLSLFATKKLSLTQFTPKLKEGRRGRRIATYATKLMSVVPIVVFVPGSDVNALNQFLPLIAINSHLSVAVVPLVVLIAAKVEKSALSSVVASLASAMRKTLWLIIALGVVSYFANFLGVWLAAGLLLGSGIIWLAAKQKLAHYSNWFVEVDDGVRILAVRPNTPASKMKLQPGDVILDCNDVAVHSETELYAALQKNSAYVKMRVKTYAGQLRLVQSAIFAGAPHEIGLMLFVDKDKTLAQLKKASEQMTKTSAKKA